MDFPPQNQDVQLCKIAYSTTAAAADRGSGLSGIGSSTQGMAGNSYTEWHNGSSGVGSGESRKDDRV